MVEALMVGPAQSWPALLLREWRYDDVAALVRMGSDDALRRWTSFPAGSEEEIRRWVGAQRDGREAGDRISFAVQEVGGEPLAHVVLKLGREAAGEVGYWTASHARGRNIAARALGALCQWAVEQYDSARLTRLELIHQVDNHASCRVAVKARFPLARVLPPQPPWPLEGHLHIRERIDVLHGS
ncbi:GNAT family N-acetyltransferase [Actinoplanes sp. NPDC049596]|uniref:GNAT family N-acetyltransferase n=1 Tax=unclassified Actinoplanes TaxID=2626549 RepID=UPI003425CCE8